MSEFFKAALDLMGLLDPSSFYNYRSPWHLPLESFFFLFLLFLAFELGLISPVDQDLVRKEDNFVFPKG